MSFVRNLSPSIVFVKPNLHITLADPHRPGHEKIYHPGETNFRSADILVINKVDTASEENIVIVEKNAKVLNPNATVIRTESPVTAEDPEGVKGKRVLVIEDGPTITHGSMAFGAGMVAAEQLGAIVVDPKPYLVGSIKDAFDKYSQLDMALPALGYSDTQLSELEAVIEAVDCDIVLSGTPIDITRVIKVSKPIIRVFYALKETDGTPLADAVKRVI